MGIVDLDVPRAEIVLDGKRQADIKGYKRTRIFTSVQDAGEALRGELAPT